MSKQYYFTKIGKKAIDSDDDESDSSSKSKEIIGNELGEFDVCCAIPCIIL